MNYYEKHIGDFIRDTVILTMLEEGAYNRLIDQAYQTERPIPSDKKMVYRLARAMTARERKAVDFVLESFFQLTDEGYVQKRVQAEIERYWERDAIKEQSKENEQERQRRTRERRKQLFEDLRSHGIVPEFNTPTKELSRMLSSVTGTGQQHDEHVTSQEKTCDVTRDNTATQTPDTSKEIDKEKTARGTRLPEDWQPSETDTAFCQQNRPDLLPSAVAQRFCDYWRSIPGRNGVKLDWSATWRNWVRNERPGQGPPPPSAKIPRREVVL